MIINEEERKGYLQLVGGVVRARSVQADTVVDQFERDGYVVVEGLLDSAADLDPIRAEYEKLLDDLATKWRQDNKITQDYRELPFDQRLRKIAAETRGEYFNHFEITLPSRIEHDSPIHLGPEVFHLLRNPKILDVVELLLGGEICSNPMQHALLKVPERDLPAALREANGPGFTSWHQDQSGASMEADQTPVITAWIPITAATIENGCLVVAPGSHKNGLCLHRGGVIPDELIGQDRIPLPMMPGDVLFMSKQVMHSSLRNKSNSIRWSFDLRYHPVGHHSGRAWFPTFVVRSRENPDQELTDAETWAQLWRSTRSRWAGRETPIRERDKRWQSF